MRHFFSKNAKRVGNWIWNNLGSIGGGVGVLSLKNLLHLEGWDILWLILCYGGFLALWMDFKDL